MLIFATNRTTAVAVKDCYTAIHVSELASETRLIPVHLQLRLFTSVTCTPQHRQMASSVAADEVYARQLLPQKCGYPLFVPEPSTNSPPKFIERGVDFGDVGIIMDGKFFFVFSVIASSDDPINHLGVPDAFRPFRLNERFFDRYPNMHKKGSELTSSSIKKHHTSVEGGVKENEYDY